ncbi:MAG: hypothetical protein IJI10_00365 [Eubacterium sp.]|nr:hypothetical protein [Eubacterium sp.]
MDLNILKRIMDDFRISGFSECRLCEAGITLELKRTVPESVQAGAAIPGGNGDAGKADGGMVSGAGTGADGGKGLYAGNAAGANAGAGMSTATGLYTGTEPSAGADLNAGTEGVQKAAADAADAAVVKAQMAGTFYTSAKPGEAPYVKEGSRVSKGDTLGLLEAMKVISEITAPVSGTVESVMLEDAAFAEFDAPLFRIRTAE